MTDHAGAPHNEERTSLGLSRRRIVQAAAWSVPAITIATAAPAYAGSPVGGATPRAYSQDFGTLGTGTFGAGALSGWGLYVKATATSIGSVYQGNQLATITNAGSVTVSKAPAPWSNSTGGFLNYASPKAPLTSLSTTANQAASTDRALGLVQSGAPTGDPYFDPGMSVVYDFSGQNGSLALKGDVTVSVDLRIVNPQARGTTWTLQYGTSDSAWVTLDTYTTTTTGSTWGEGEVLTGVVPNAETGSVKFRVVTLTGSAGSNSRDGITLDDFLVSWVE
jgi:hypothetical protein